MFILSNYSGPPIAGIICHLTGRVLSGPPVPGMPLILVGLILSGPPVPGMPPRWKYVKPAKDARTSMRATKTQSFFLFTQYHFLLHFRFENRSWQVTRREKGRNEQERIGLACSLKPPLTCQLLPQYHAMLVSLNRLWMTLLEHNSRCRFNVDRLSTQ